MAEGRWPTNVILAPDMAEVLDQQSGVSKSQKINATAGGAFRRDGCQSIEELRELAERGEKTPNGRDARLTLARHETESAKRTEYGYVDEGGASRFFLSAWYEPEELAWIYAVGLTPYGQE